MPKPTFSPSEAQALINTARAAPLRDMQHADSVNQMLQKFVTWYNSTLPKAKPEVSPK